MSSKYSAGLWWAENRLRDHVDPWSNMSHGLVADSVHSCQETPRVSSWWKRLSTFWWQACCPGTSPLVNEKSLLRSQRTNCPETIAA